MPSTSPKCVRCDKPMVEGYLAGPWMSQPRQIQTWVKGRPMTPADFSIKGKGAKPLVITSWRCAACGLLESYAK